MGYQVDGRIEVSIFINNVEYPLDTFNILNFLHIGTSTRQILPTCHFAITDVLHILDSIDIQDGIPLRITLRALQSDTLTFNFRKFHHKKIFNGASFVYEVDGYLDAPRYWAGTSCAGLKGTSGEVLSQIANLCGLTYSGDNTNDSQLWLQRNRTYGEFARKITSRAYLDDKSYMGLGVEFDGTLLFKNISALPSTQQKIILGQYVGGAMTAVDYLPVATSGINNKMTGYQNSKFTQNLIDDKTFNSYTDVTFTPNVKSPYFNQTIKDKIILGYRTFGGIEVGNTYENYDRAIYQNIRLANTYSLDVQFLMQLPTTLRLFDKFTFSVDTEQQKQDVSYAGEYIVSARALYVVGVNFAEKIIGTRTGVNSDNVQG